MRIMYVIHRVAALAVFSIALAGCGGGGGGGAAPVTNAQPSPPPPATTPPPEPPPVTPTPAEFTLNGPTVYSMPVWPDAWPDVVAVADIDGDGLKDAIVATTMTNQDSHPQTDWKLYIFHQLTNGTLSSPVVVPYSSLAEETFRSGGTRRRTTIASTDLNGDGIADLVVGQRTGLSIVYGRRDRSYIATHVSNAAGVISGDAFTFLDADGDGQVDIASHNETSEQGKWGLTVFFGDPAGTYARQRFLPTSNDGDVELAKGDLNSDGHTDLAVSSGQGLSQRVEILLGDGAGDFSNKLVISKPPGLMRLSTIAVADFSGEDGADDLVMAGNDQEFSGGAYFLFKQVNGVLISSPIQLPSTSPKDTANTPDTMIAADLNGDRKADLITLRSGGQLGYLEQRNGELIKEQIFDGPYATWGGQIPIAVGDLTGDGCADVATANYNYGLVIWQGYGCSR